MIELRHDSLVFSFPEVHPSATVSIAFQRTLRIPDDDKNSALPGSKTLAGMKSVATLEKEKKDVPLPENQAVSPEHVITLRRGLAMDQVRDYGE